MMMSTTANHADATSRSASSVGRYAPRLRTLCSTPPREARCETGSRAGRRGPKLRCPCTSLWRMVSDEERIAERSTELEQAQRPSGHLAG